MRSFIQHNPLEQRKASYIFISQIGFLSIIVIATRLPFVNAGYGNEPLAWRIAYAAQVFASSGTYTISRYPGHPITELAFSLFWKGGPIALNLLTAFMSVIAVIFFVLILRVKYYNELFIAGFTFALIPAVYIASTSSIYYIWGLAFYIISLYFVLKRQPVISGIFLGLAIGCGINYIFFILPLSYLLLKQTMKVNLRLLFIFICVTFISGIISFSPVISKYGINYFIPTFSEFLWNIKLTFSTFTKGVWGQVGLIGLFLGLLSFLIHLFNNPQKVLPLFLKDSFIIYNLMTIGISIATIIKNPYEPAYLLPAVPSILFILYQVLNKKLYILVNSLLILSSLINFSQFRLVPGPIIGDFQDRILWLKFTEVVKEKVRHLTGKKIIVTGDWFPKFQLELPGHPKENFTQYAYTLNEQSKINLENGYITYVARLSEGEADYFTDRSYHVYYLPDSRKYTNFTGESRDKVSALFGESSAEARILMELIK